MRAFTRDRHFYGRFFQLTFSIALQNVLVFTVNFADNIMLGRYSEPSMAGVSLVNQIQFLLQMLVMGVGEGLLVLAARYWGERRIEPIRRLTTIGLWLGGGIGLLMFGAAFCFPEQLLSLLTSEPAALAEGVKYLRIICFSYVFFGITNILIASLRSVESVAIAFVVSTSTLLVNVGLNYILIFGHFGAPRLGVRGAAIATLTARIIETGIMVVYTRFADRKIHFRLRHLFHFDRKLFGDFIRVGSPVFFSNAIWGLAMAVQTAILGHMAARYPSIISANGIATTVFQFLTVVLYGSASATTVLIGKTIGEGRREDAKQYAVTLQLLYLLIGGATGLLLFCLRDPILQFYTVSDAAKSLARQFMTVLSITVVGTAYQMPALTGIVRGGGETNFVLYNDMIFMWLIVLPSSALAAFVFHLSPLVVFICLKSDQILKCFVAVVKVNRFRWIRDFAGKPKAEKQLS